MSFPFLVLDEPRYERWNFLKNPEIDKVTLAHTPSCANRFPEHGSLWDSVWMLGLMIRDNMSWKRFFSRVQVLAKVTHSQVHDYGFHELGSLWDPVTILGRMSRDMFRRKSLSFFLNWRSYDRICGVWSMIGDYDIAEHGFVVYWCTRTLVISITLENETLMPIMCQRNCRFAV